MIRDTHNLVQGTNEWLAFRASHYGASDAPAMMNASKYRSRGDLLREKASGIAPEISPEQQALFDRGHAAEAAIRPVIEKMLADELYPVTMSADIDGLPLSASLDGLTLDGTTVFECKLWNEALAEQVRAENLDPHYYLQLEQQLLVSGAERAIFATGDGADRLETMYYRAVPGRAEALIAGWKRFQQDIAEYQPAPAAAPAPVAAPIEGFGALTLRVEGRVLASNLDAFRAGAEAFIARLPKPADLRTDQDFVDADAAVKACADAEKRITAAKDAALAQMADVDAVMRAADHVTEAIRAARLALDKTVKAEKEHRRAEIVAHYQQQVRAHYETINATLGEHALSVPLDAIASIGAAIKGRKTLGSITDAADAACAAAKIVGSQQAERVRQNIAVLAEYAEHAHLFADRVALCAGKTPEDLRNLAKARIAEHKQREAARLEAERERIRQEEQAKVQREAEALRREQESARPAGAPAANVAPIATAGDVYAAIVEPGPGDHDLPPVKLGDIVASIAPLSISAGGLAQLGFQPLAAKGATKLYAAADVPAMHVAMIDVIRGTRQQRKAG